MQCFICAFSTHVSHPTCKDYVMLIHMGSTDAWGRCTRIPLNPGDTVLAEEWMYPSVTSIQINLLPLPALDGGTLALLLVEAVRGGRRIPREVEQSITSSGVLLVVMLGLFLIVRDTLNLDFIKEML